LVLAREARFAVDVSVPNQVGISRPTEECGEAWIKRLPSLREPELAKTSRGAAMIFVATVELFLFSLIRLRSARPH